MAVHSSQKSLRSLWRDTSIVTDISMVDRENNLPAGSRALLFLFFISMLELKIFINHNSYYIASSRFLERNILVF